MEIKKIYVEKIDNQTGQVLPRVQTSGGLIKREFFGRNLPITNRVAWIEDRRVHVFGKDPFSSNFCFITIPYYSDPELKEYINQNLRVLSNQPNENRIHLVGLQRKKDDRKILTAKESLSTFDSFVGTGVKYVPIEMPFRLSIPDAKKFAKDAESTIRKNQNLILDVDIRQDQEWIGEILQDEINKGSHFFYVNAGSLREEKSILTCAKIWDITRRIKEGDNIPLIVAKHPMRYQESYSRVASSFAFNLFNFPMVVEYYYTVPEEVKKDFNRKEIEKYAIYDPIEGGFVYSKYQEMLNQRSVLKELFQTNSLMEGFGPYDAVLCSNFMSQQIDTSLQNDHILNDKFIDLVNNKSEESKILWSNLYNETLKKLKDISLLRSNAF